MIPFLCYNPRNPTGLLRVLWECVWLGGFGVSCYARLQPLFLHLRRSVSCCIRVQGFGFRETLSSVRQKPLTLNSKTLNPKTSPNHKISHLQALQVRAWPPTRATFVPKCMPVVQNLGFRVFRITLNCQNLLLAGSLRNPLFRLIIRTPGKQ